MDTFRLEFALAKETKNTEKYEEKPEAGQPPRIGTLYVQKWALGDTAPKSLTVTVEEA